MNWLGQAAHVAVKDLKQQRWPMVAYVVVGIVTTIHASILPSRSEFSVAMPVLVLLGVIITASIVQNDAPAKSNEFWISRPFFPTAVLGAKILFAVAGMLVLALVGEAVALRSFAIHPAEIASLLGQSVAMYGYWLLGAIIVAAITTDIRSFIVAALFLVLGLFAAGSVLPGRSLTSAGSSPALQIGLLAVAVLGGLALLAWIYRTRDAGRVVWLGAIVVLAAILLRAVSIDRRQFDRQLPAGVAAPKITMSIDDASHLADRHRIRVRLTIDSSTAPQRVSFAADRAILHLRDGSSLPLTSYRASMILRLGNAGLPPGVHAISEENSAESGVFDLSVGPRPAIQSGDIRSIEIAGHVSIAEATPIASMPSALGQIRASNGVRVRVSDVKLGPAGSAIQLETVTVLPPSSDLAAYFNPTLSVALINDSAGEARVLHTTANSSSTDWLVLPGVPIVTGTLTLNGNTRPDGADPSARDESWYRDSRVSIVQWDTQARYPVQLTLTMP